MDSEGISFGQMLDNDFGEPAEQPESLERASSSAPSQTTAPEAMQVDEGAGYVYLGGVLRNSHAILCATTSNSKEKEEKHNSG